MITDSQLGVVFDWFLLAPSVIQSSLIFSIATEILPFLFY